MHLSLPLCAIAWFLFVTKQQPLLLPWQTINNPTLLRVFACQLPCEHHLFSGKMAATPVFNQGYLWISLHTGLCCENGDFLTLENIKIFCMRTCVYWEIIHKVRIIRNILIILEVQPTVFGTVWFVCGCVSQRLQKALWTATCCSVYQRYSLT